MINVDSLLDSFANLSLGNAKSWEKKLSKKSSQQSLVTLLSLVLRVRLFLALICNLQFLLPQFLQLLYQGLILQFEFLSGSAFVLNVIPFLLIGM